MRFLEDSRSPWSTVAWTGPVRKKFHLFRVLSLLMISDEDFYGGRTGTVLPLEKFHLFIYFL